MNQLQSKLKELNQMLIDDGYNGSNIVIQTLEEIREETINYTRCSLQLNHEDLAIGQQVSITQTKLVEINCFREDGDIDVEDTNSVFTVGINEISKVV
jgi:hypothetical protein